MNEHSDPIEFLIEFAWANGADKFVVNNAKDELKKLHKELEQTKNAYNKLLSIFNYPIAYGKINDRNDLYDLRISNNPKEDQTKVVPLYSNRTEFLTGDWKGYNNYGKRTQ